MRRTQTDANQFIVLKCETKLSVTLTGATGAGHDSLTRGSDTTDEKQRFKPSRSVSGNENEIKVNDDFRTAYT